MSVVYAVFSQDTKEGENLEGLFWDIRKAEAYRLEQELTEVLEYGLRISKYEVRKVHVA